MIFVGMDVHSKSTTFCLLDPAMPEGRQHRWETVPTTAADFARILKPLDRQCKVAFEVGCQAQWVKRAVSPLAAEVQVANASRIPWLFRDGRKNDRLDASKLAMLLYLDQLPRVHLPSREVSAWRALIQNRRRLVQRRTGVKNQIRAILRSEMIVCPWRSCWTRRGLRWLMSLQQETTKLEPTKSLILSMHLEQLAVISLQILQVEQRLDEMAALDGRVALIRTVPGIGPRTAEAIVAFTDDVRRFQNCRQFASYFGMTPTEDTSAGLVRYGHISKRGPSVVRWVLVEAIYQVVRRVPELRAILERVQRGRKDRRKKAIVAVARKLLTILFAMLRDGTPFDASKVSLAA
jgi:transposase